MPTSLASQLQNIASLDAERLTSRYGRPSSKSYLFPPNVASEHDLDAVHALGQSGFDELVQLDPRMDEFEDELFSEGAKRTDRMMLSQEENAALDLVLAKCLRRLGKWIGIMAGGKCIEWLVRRFRVHEMNADMVLQVFLPYHDSPNFARMLAILSLPKSSPYNAPFYPLSKKAQPVPREYITSAISSARDPSLRLLTDLCQSIKIALEEETIHRALLAFWTSTLVDLLQRSRVGAGGRLAEGVVKILVETFVSLLSANGGAEVNAAVYPPLVLLSRTVRLADGPFAAILEALLTPNSGADPSQRILTLLVLLDQRKGWTQGLGEDAAKRLSKIPQLGQMLIAAMEKYGFETAMQTVIAALAEDVAVTEETLTTLVDFPLLPAPVVKLAAEKLLTPSDKAVARELLSTLKQRHPEIVDTAVLENTSVDPALVQWSSSQTAFIDVHSADVGARVSGVKEMYAVAESADLDQMNAAELLKEDKLKSAQTAILARLRDTDEVVLKAIYAEPELLLALLTGSDYVEAITAAFVAPQPSREVLGLHLGFIGSAYLGVHPEDERRVFEQLLVPNLLATETRRALGPQQWPAVMKCCCLVNRVNGDVALDASKEELIKFNQDLIKNLAGAIAASGDIGARVDPLVASLSSPLPTARLLASLALAQLVSCAGGYQHVVAARSLGALDRYLSDKNLLDVTETESPLSEALLKAVVSKPDATRTQQRACLALLTSSAAVPPSPNTTCWLVDVASASAEGQVHAVSHALYRWANSASLSTAVAKHLLHAVFGQLGEDTLVFLAAVWTGYDADSTLRVAALKHASAFVKAYTTSGKETDFQLAIPATLMALRDSSKPVRQAAAGLLRAIAAAPQSSGAEIYALESIYGSRSDLVQLLKPSDLSKYLQTLVSELDDMVTDAGRLALVHGQSLDLQSKNGKKDTLFRRDVVDWLMSHVLAWRAGIARRSLLSSLDRAINVSRLQGSLPLLTPLIDETKDEAQWLEHGLPQTHQDEYLELVFNSFTARHAAAITGDDSEVWKFLLELVAKNTPMALRLRKLALQKLEEGLFAALRTQQKVEFVVALVQSLYNMPVDVKLASRATLAKLFLTPTEVSSAVQVLLEPLHTSVVRKKAKTEDDDVDKTAAAVSDLTVFIESRDWKTLPGDAPLVAVLMGVLSAVLSKRQAIKEGVDYLEQEVLGGILAQVEKITDAAELNRARVGIEVIVKVIRASSNPRTSQRALLVASELARLIPDSVLHNVMPIFTFMGSSDLQRDDAFSFSVVEKTVSRIVPVMVKSLKDKAESKTELYAASYDFLSIFTDMANRLPKHRTLPFFVHLVKSLGVEDFLAPVCMLLADKSKKSTSLELPLSLIASFPASPRTNAILQITREITLVIEDNDDAFLDYAEHQVAMLLQMVAGAAKGLGGKVCPQPAVEEVVRLLVALAPTKAEDETAQETAIKATMQLLSVDSFLSMTAKIVESGSEGDKARALDMFATRLPLIRADLRAKSKDMGKIIAGAAGMLPSAQALAALVAVVSSAVPSEDSPLAVAVPVVVKVARTAPADSAPAVLILLASMVRRLGPRAIPFVQAVLDACLALIGAVGDVPAAAFAALASLVETVPTFISTKQLVALLAAGARHRASDEVASASLLNAAAKKVPTKTLVPVLMELWKVLKADSDAAIVGFFALLRSTLRNAERTSLPTLQKPLFAFFLDAFDLRHTSKLGEAIDGVESSAIASFLELVTKLSDAAFKPLFARLYDWAVVDLQKPVNDAHVVDRRIVLLRIMDGLLERFRHLLTPYMATLLPLVEELLPAFAAGDVADAKLWTLLLSVLGKSMDVDDGAYWTDALLLRLLPGLAAQLSLPSQLGVLAAQTDSASARVLASVAASCQNEVTLKRANGAVCMATRAEEPRARLAALRALEAMWERHADELIPLVPETVAEFLAELLEDENSDVEAGARRVLAKIESVTGSLKEYLE